MAAAALTRGRCQKLDAAADVARALDARIGELTAERARSAHRIAALEDQVRCVTEAATQADADARAERHRALELAEERRAQDLAGAAQQYPPRRSSRVGRREDSTRCGRSAAALAQVREEGRRAVLEALEAARADLDRQRLEWARDADVRRGRRASARSRLSDARASSIRSACNVSCRPGKRPRSPSGRAESRPTPIACEPSSKGTPRRSPKCPGRGACRTRHGGGAPPFA